MVVMEEKNKSVTMTITWYYCPANTIQVAGIVWQLLLNVVRKLWEVGHLNSSVSANRVTI